ncbi:segregation and condensation protein A [Tepidibacter formicigenes]|jgi:segregation and condensation protein A|uniref:Segregation and condensation protein A n=1 Tax=Tepidibacter formicigenes DSM 15518 TaxID=1123349 RepID=A0A1M6PDI0_9FIRM|nr:segregation/condensation protein A [Tepidibacter formicigenes]SHK05996.1 condensin subunit ScpA [Tepidibacter formicigenes DSM 15518]
MGYNITLKAYEGPLDLLYDLIIKNKIDIYDISIFEITDQYLKYLKKMEKMDLEITSDFIIMACKLLETKSKYLLYKKNEEEEDDPRKELMHKLVEYKKFKNVAQFLKDKMYCGEGIFHRKKEEIYFEEKLDLSNLNIEMLINFLPNIIKETKVKDNKLEKVYKRETISLEEQINYVRHEIDKKGTLLFKELVKSENKEEIIVTFLSILELIKNKEVIIKQENFFSDIIVKKVE